MNEQGFWRLERLTDGELLESLGAVMRTQRRALAELVAHLGEVEERRLHLAAACSSMFAYCVGRLGMSEDEACRRIDLARLARTFPALFAELASGRISLSVALVLKPALSSANHHELLAAARGASVERARALVAERFPKPDVPSRIRQLPERGNSARASVSAGLAPAPSQQPLLSMRSPLPSSPPPAASAASGPGPTPAFGSVSRSSRARIEPLSAQRYKVQFSADAELKRKLELARDLLRHAHPGGDFGPVVARALDLLIEDLLGRRFGARKRRSRAEGRSASASPSGAPSAVALSPSSASSPLSAAVSASVAPPSSGSSPLSASSPSRSRTARIDPVRRAARRAVVERDGLGCSWVDANGVRCGSRAWLEFDHRHPAGKGGGSGPDNLRLLCHAHNRFAAERAYGRAHIERAMFAHREHRVGERRQE